MEIICEHKNVHECASDVGQVLCDDCGCRFVQRYFVTGPVEGGYCWYDVREQKNNMPIASFRKDLPRSKNRAFSLRDELNEVQHLYEL